MLDKDFIRRKITLIEKELMVLVKYKNITFEETAENFETQAIVERLLERIITRAIDINRHILAENGSQLAPVTKYRETFLRLAELNVYPKEFAKKLAPSAGFRNALVHDYNNIDKSILQKSIKQAIEEFNEYSKYVLGFIDKQI
jgi:uncharacterized protein YutE (UPF0331/DUF86 family)